MGFFRPLQGGKNIRWLLLLNYLLVIIEILLVIIELLLIIVIIIVIFIIINDYYL